MLFINHKNPTKIFLSETSPLGNLQLKKSAKSLINSNHMQTGSHTSPH